MDEPPNRRLTSVKLMRLEPRSDVGQGLQRQGLTGPEPLRWRWILKGNESSDDGTRGVAITEPGDGAPHRFFEISVMFEGAPEGERDCVLAQNFGTAAQLQRRVGGGHVEAE